jgi:hypothetical protein
VVVLVEAHFGSAVLLEAPVLVLALLLLLNFFLPRSAHDRRSEALPLFGLRTSGTVKDFTTPANETALEPAGSVASGLRTWRGNDGRLRSAPDIPAPSFTTEQHRCGKREGGHARLDARQNRHRS